MSCDSGEIRFEVLRMDLDGKNLTASLNGRAVAVKTSRADGLTVLTFRKGVLLKEGQVLTAAVCGS